MHLNKFDSHALRIYPLTEKQYKISLYPGKENVKKGISIFTVCMNRNKSLLYNIDTWLNHPKVDEVIVVDWSSTIPVQETLQCHLHPHLTIARVDHQKKWILTTSFNLAARLTTKNKILKLDCDVALGIDFFDKHVLRKGIVFGGDYKKATNINQKYLNGALYVKRKDFFAVNGYNEYITTYGWDDDDIKSRLENNINGSNLNNKKQKTTHSTLVSMDSNSLFHIEHSDKDRIIYQPGVLDLSLEIQKNRFLCKNFSFWGLHERMTPFQIFENTDSNNLIHCVKDPFWNYQIPDDIWWQCEKLALETLLHDKFGVPWFTCKKKTLLQLQQLYFSFKSKKIILRVYNGLGNRLRAMASAKVIADCTGRSLIIIWKKDEHCNCNFEDIFDLSSCLLYNITDDFNETLLQFGFDIYDYEQESDLERIIKTESCLDIYIRSACVLTHKDVTWSSICEALYVLFKPVREIQETIECFQKTFSVPVESMIGIHIRMGQEGYSFEDTSRWSENSKNSLTKWRNKSHYLHFQTEMEGLLQSNPSVVFYVAADNQFIYDHFEKVFGNTKIVFLKRNMYDRSLEQVKTAVIDLHFLSRCKVFYASNWSSFSEIAMRLGRKQTFISGVNFNTEENIKNN